MDIKSVLDRHRTTMRASVGFSSRTAVQVGISGIHILLIIFTPSTFSSLPLLSLSLTPLTWNGAGQQMPGPALRETERVYSWTEVTWPFRKCRAGCERG